MPARLTSKERVQRAMSYQEADRVPVDFDCSQQDKVEELIAYCGVENNRISGKVFL